MHRVRKPGDIHKFFLGGFKTPFNQWSSAAFKRASRPEQGTVSP